MLFFIFVPYLYHFMQKKIIITIDGWSSCGKSTLAKQLAKELGYIYIDSGAMYRAITLFFLRNDYKQPPTLGVHSPLRQAIPRSGLRQYSWYRW